MTSGVPFHWHIVEGVSNLVRDTGWSISNGGYIDSYFHSNGRSIDGTSEFIDQLQNNGQLVTVYRSQEKFWNGKVDMMNAPMDNIDVGDILWQVDVDEFWEPESIRKLFEIFAHNQHVNHAQFYCNYWVGPKLLLTSRGGWGNNPVGEWKRVWRKRRDSYFLSHEPPLFVWRNGVGDLEDVASSGALPNSQTEFLGLIFDHLGYVYREQLQFKESYYGYKGALERWLSLQTDPRDSIPLRDYFAWVDSESRVRRVSADICERWGLPGELSI